MSDDYIPPAIDGCSCLCHRQPGVMHFMACCGTGSIPARVRDAIDTLPTTSGDVGKLCERLLLAGGNAFPHEPKTAKEEMCMQAATLLTQMEAREIALRDALETAESALDQLLDDMGETGQCVCPAAKFEAIDALANVRRTLNPTPTEER